MLVEHVVGADLLLLAAQLLNLGPELRDLIAVGLLLAGQLALVSAQFGIVASAESVCLASLGLQFALDVVGVSPLACLFLL